MIGNTQDPGIMVRIMSDLFVHSAKQGGKQGVIYKVSVSFLEVYNENIRDLLSDVEEYLGEYRCFVNMICLPFLLHL